MVDLQHQSGKKIDFEYGRCYTDLKNGKKIRTDFREIDFINDSPYAERISKMLNQMGLPMPEDAQVFRGTHHDMLFLNSHGVVIRIGPLDVEDLINPGILQPLGWLEDRDFNVKIDVEQSETAPLTVAIYPGIELYQDYIDDDNRPKSAGPLCEFLTQTGAGSTDAFSYKNKGVIRIQDETGQEIAVEMLLDVDNFYNGSSPNLSSRRSVIRKRNEKKYNNTGDAISQTLSETFKDAQNISWWQKAFQMHQPLRNQFWKAFKDMDAAGGDVNIIELEAFWKLCAASTKKPSIEEPCSKKIHLCRQENNSIIREEIDMPKVFLYTPWATPPNFENFKTKAYKSLQAFYGNLFVEYGKQQSFQKPNTQINIRHPSRE